MVMHLFRWALPPKGIQSTWDGSLRLFMGHSLCNSYTMGCPPVRVDNPRPLAYRWTNMVPADPLYNDNVCSRFSLTLK